jgi:Amt family ammonium transporter
VKRWTKFLPFVLLGLILIGSATTVQAADDPVKVATDAAKAAQSAADGVALAADTMWTLIAGMLVFFMNLGFAMVESGLCRAKNCVNILAKNFIVFACASLAYLVLGWGLMFGDGSPFMGSTGLIFVNGGVDNSPVKVRLKDLITTDAGEALGVDLSTDEAKTKYEKLLGAISDLDDKARAEITANTKKVKTKVKEGDKEVEKEEDKPVTFKVALELPDGKPKLEKEYEASSFYWGAYSAISWATIPLWAKFFFQLVFAGTAATIVSGAVAERIKFGSFIIFSFVLCGVIYPIIGHMIWGGGYAGSNGMFDFAGSTVVHSCGGWAALAGVIVLGPRLGKYGPNGEANTIPGHSMTSVTLGGLVLWFGWFGFNPGSTMGVVGYADAIGHIAVTTNTAAAAATISAAITAWLLLGKPDLSMIINGTLAGLVAITAPCAFVSVFSSLIIGLIAGVIVVFAVLFFDKVKLDDPVGALSVHLVNGVFGTLCVGLFAQKGICSAGTASDGLFFGGGTAQLMPQIIGVVLAGAITFILSLVTWIVLKVTVGVRVSDHEQIEGLDLGEHNMAAYPDFQITSIKSYHIREA